MTTKAFCIEFKKPTTKLQTLLVCKKCDKKMSEVHTNDWACDECHNPQTIDTNGPKYLRILARV